MLPTSVNFVVLLAVVLIALAEGVIQPLPPHVGLPTQDGLTRLFFNSRVTRRDPRTSVACFEGYIGESNLIAEQYSGAYGGCLHEAQNSRHGIDKDFLPMRHRIEKSAQAVCDSLRICSQVNVTLDSFNCHAAAGSNNTVATYGISGNASESATLLQERYRLIDLHHEQCMTKAERSYVESTAKNYNYLQACLDGRIKPKPIPSTTTSTTTTTTTTTEAPTTSTTTTTTTTTPEPTETTEGVDNLEDQFKQLLNLLN
ncbi:exocyst complex component 5 [Drosophila grimshawi]|uniref:GH15758 n=1 Tax=Drosophila grimshawi TaxID=7222 RepID=B4IYM0_DROGR|nr:exocyst complex component 5 [Drosophila grimshawi]EDV95530.1 GH15758 [Drosophila grimshawi]